MFTYYPPSPSEDVPTGIAEAFRAMQAAMEQSPDWVSLAAARQMQVQQPPIRRVQRLTASERTAIAKKAAAARWARPRPG